jgi:hypothetical protein
MGQASTHYSVSSNGFTQLWTSTTGTPSSATTNAAIPTAATPNAYIAPFWDDLVPGANNRIHVLDVATAPRHFTIEWTDHTIFGQTGSLVRFQVKLFETTNVIEFHYCRVTTGASSNAVVTGSGATIGVENSTGTIAVQQSKDTANAIMQGGGFRFTPM